MMRLRRLGGAMAAALSASAVQAQEMPVGTPLTAWEADFADRDCGLKRHFQLGDGIVSLAIRANAPNHLLKVTVFAETLERKGRDAATSFAGSELLEHDYFVDLESGDWEGLEVNVPPEYFEKPDAGENSGSNLTIREAFESDFALDLKDIGPALKVMDQCLDDLLSNWGIDPSEYRSLSRRTAPAKDDMQWFFSSIRPAMRSKYVKAGDPVELFLRIGPDGRVTQCTMDGEVGKSRAGERSCKNIVRIARFEPALDAEGNPTESFYAATWRTRRSSPIDSLP